MTKRQVNHILTGLADVVKDNGGVHPAGQSIIDHDEWCQAVCDLFHISADDLDVDLFDGPRQVQGWIEAFWLKHRRQLAKI